MTEQRRPQDPAVGLKRVGASNVLNVELERIPGIESVRVTGPVSPTFRLVLAALAKVLEAESIFEIGTHLGETTWTVAHNQPTARVYTLDLPGPRSDRGRYFRGTPEAVRITQLVGDTASFDFSPYRRQMDLVFIDASHGYSTVRSDTDAAFGMLSELGMIAWDDHTHYPSVYAYLSEIAPSLDRPIFHILGTGLAVYSRWDVLLPH